MPIECAECNDFVAYSERAFGPLIARLGGAPARCHAEYDGRECLFMVRARGCSLLFVRSDGADDCALGTVDAPFVDDRALQLTGEAGWYNAAFLIEYKSGKKLLTRQVVDQVWSGKLDYFVWLADHLSRWIDQLLPMFAPGVPPTWHDDFLRYVQQR